MAMSATNTPPNPSSESHRLAAGLPLLAPPLLTEPRWAEGTGAFPTAHEYTDMCRDVYEHYADERARKATDLGTIENCERLLYMNFKSHAIFSEEQVARFFS